MSDYSLPSSPDTRPDGSVTPLTTSEASASTVPSQESEHAGSSQLSDTTTPAAMDYVSLIMERNFLKNALADLDFHNNAHDGIVFLDTQARVVYANPYFLEMTGYADPKEILGKPLPQDLWEDATVPQRIIEDVTNFGYVREREVIMRNRESAPIFAVCSSVASRDDKGAMLGVEMMLCNITNKRRVEAELRDRTRQLQRVMGFAETSLTMLDDLVKRRATHNEMQPILNDLRAELSKLV